MESLRDRDPHEETVGSVGGPTSGAGPAAGGGRRRVGGILAGIVALALAAPAIPGTPVVQAADEEFGFITRWGSDGDGQLDRPEGIATDAAGNVYVVDWWNDRIQKFDSGGAFITMWGGEGSGPGQFYQIGSIATDAAGDVYVSDLWTNNTDRVQKFTPEGEFVTWWEAPGHVSDMAGAPDGSLYVAGGTPFREYIQKLSSTGSLINEWGSEGDGDGQFRGITGIAIAPDGSVYAADQGYEDTLTYTPRIQRFTSDGEFVTKWGSEGVGDGQFIGGGLGGVATDADGNVWVGEETSEDDAFETIPRIQKFTASGSFLTKWNGSSSSDGPSFMCLSGIATGAASSVYVANWCANEVWKFGPGGTTSASMFRPDGLISKARNKKYAGDGRYNATGKKQARKAKMQRGKAATFFIRGQNDGGAVDTFTVKGCKSGRGFKVIYLDGPKGTKKITKKVVKGNHRLENVAPGQEKTLRARIKVTKKAKTGRAKPCRVVLTSAGDPTKNDAVKAKVVARG